MSIFNIKMLLICGGVAILLPGCFGGGGSSSPPSNTTPPPSDTTPPPSDTTPPPSDTPPQLARAAVAGDLIVEFEGELIRENISCQETKCVFSFLGTPGEFPTSGALPGAGQMQRNGVSIGRESASAEGLQVHTYGVWGNDNYGFASVTTGSAGGVSFRYAFPVSIGNATGSNPVSGTASWSGAMVGMKIGSSSIGDEVTGDADMTADLEAASIDLEFTNIATQSGVESPAIRWQGAPMRSGAFSDSGLDGRFYGSDHAEAGGVFKRDGIEGAFSLVRD